MGIFNILGAIWFFLALKFDVEDNYKKWKNNIPVKHTKEALLRCLLLIPSIFLLSMPFPLNVWDILITTALEAFTYLLLFDGFYNLKRKQNWWFLGSVDKDDAWWDKQQRKIPLWLLKILKIGVPATFLALKLVG